MKFVDGRTGTLHYPRHGSMDWGSWRDSDEVLEWLECASLRVGRGDVFLGTTHPEGRYLNMPAPEHNWRWGAPSTVVQAEIDAAKSAQQMARREQRRHRKRESQARLRQALSDQRARWAAIDAQKDADRQFVNELKACQENARRLADEVLRKCSPPFN